MDSATVLGVIIVSAATRAAGRAASALLQAMLLAAVWVALMATGAAMLLARMVRGVRRVALPRHFQIHW